MATTIGLQDYPLGIVDKQLGRTKTAASSDAPYVAPGIFVHRNTATGIQNH